MILNSIRFHHRHYLTNENKDATLHTVERLGKEFIIMGTQDPPHYDGPGVYFTRIDRTPFLYSTVHPFCLSWHFLE